jgi:RimJ/RimL family protein N-acetyltransferase
MDDKEFLEHFGILGMKWGRRKVKTPVEIKSRSKSLTTKLKNGDTLTMDGDQTPKTAMFIAKYIPYIRNNINNTSNFTIKDNDNKVIGEMQLYKESKDSLNVVWVGIHDSERGKGYATAAMNTAVKFAKDQQLKTVTLEVPGHSPDARHIYEKIGFKAGESFGNKNDMWGGLTKMTLDISHNNKESLEHFGILGMHWGRRKRKSTTNSEDHNVKELLKTKKPNELSNVELKKLTERLQLEKSYNELTKAQMSPGKKYIIDFLKTQGAMQLNAIVNKQVGKLINQYL